MLKGKRLITISLAITLCATLMPMDGKMAGNYLDKLAHFLLYFILGISVFITFGKGEPSLQMLLCAALMGLLFEAVLHYIPGRTMSVYDAISNTLGLVAAMVLSLSKEAGSMKTVSKLNKWN